MKSTPSDPNQPQRAAAPTMATGPTPVKGTSRRRATDGPIRALVVSSCAQRREVLRTALKSAAMTCASVCSARSAMQRIRTWAGVSPADSENDRGGFDVIVCDTQLQDGEGIDLALVVGGGGVGLVLVGENVDAGQAIDAMRAGAADILSIDTHSGEIARRVAIAAERARVRRRERGRIVRLKRMCRRLNSAREKVARQVDTLCTDLVQAYQELAEHMNQVTTATEFKGLIQSELDIESLLRTTLEFVLSRSGPTNAAIFLPTTSGDYSLGAYVNYDCPKETVDILLDQLANSVAPRFEATTGLICLSDPAALDRYVGDEAQWLEGSSVAAMACRHEGETLAIFMLFRDRRNPFNSTLLEQVKTIGELFAAQLARVIHIHHRHLPKDKWGMLGDPEHGADGYGDLAA